MGKVRKADTTRYVSLDGLRGLAALVVVIHHCFLVSPELSAAGTSGDLSASQAWVWWITFTPLHLLWAGEEAVFVFFILSGFVLTLPITRSSGHVWTAYYAKRIVRIYLPVWGSLALASVMAWAVPRVAHADFSSWLNLHDKHSNVLVDAFLLGGAGPLNSPLWSLQWEMVFSLLLPLYWLVAARCQRRWLLGVLGLVLLIGLAEQSRSAGPVVLPIFGIGVLLAARLDAVELWAKRLRWWHWVALVLMSICLLSSRWLFPQAPVPIAMASVGGALLLIAFIGCEPAISLGIKPLVRWLGTRSFSLYLVHEPIVVSVAFALHLTNPFLVALIAIPLSLVVTELFFRFLDKPSHMLAGTAGKMAANRSRRTRKHPNLHSVRP